MASLISAQRVLLAGGWGGAADCGGGGGEGDLEVGFLA